MSRTAVTKKRKSPTIAADGYSICPKCGHHTSAYQGVCTTMIPVDDDRWLVPCRCDCRVEMGEPSLKETVASWFRKDV